MANLDRIQRLVERALDDFDSPDRTVAALLRQCLRIATLRNDFSNLIWLELEATELTKNEGSSGPLPYLGPSLMLHFDEHEANRIFSEEYDSYTKRRAMTSEGSEGITGLSVEQIEDRITGARHVFDGMGTPDGPRWETVATGRMKVLLSLRPLELVLARVRARLFRFLTETEKALDFGQVNADVFERLRQDVDAALGDFAPEALAKFTSAARRASEGDPEALSQALTSCRRVLKATADAVYPATDQAVTGSDGRERKMTDDAYVNRLLQAVSDAVGKHGTGQVVQATLETVGKRLIALNELSSKGVHADVTREEVDTCVVQTYLMVGDVLRITAGQSGALVVTDPSV